MPKKLDGYADEGSSKGVRITCKDTNGDAFVPDSMSYTLTDLDGNVIDDLEDVSVTTPAAVVDIILPASAMILTDQTNKYETRVLTVTAIDGTETIKMQAEFTVKNLLLAE
jgi:hypothetical protein